MLYRGLRREGTRRRVPTVFALILGLALLGFLPVAGSEPARAATVPLTLYVNLITGWATSPESGRNPTIVVKYGDELSVTMHSEDGFEHALVINYPDPNRDYESPPTTGMVEFSFTANVSGEFNYYDRSLAVNGGPWVTKLNRPPSVTAMEPSLGTSWTADVSHDIVFETSDPDSDPLVVDLTYSHSGGSVSGSIGEFTSSPVPWVPTGFSATDTVIHVTVRDPDGDSSSAQSPPFEVDGSRPAITGRSPLRDAIGVDLGTEISVTWSEEMNRQATGGPNTFGVRPTGGAWLPGTVSWSPEGTRMAFHPETALSPGTSYEVHVNDTARDDSNPGNAFGGDVWTFSTGSTTDLTPPSILAVTANPPRQVPGGFVNLTADVDDNAGVAGLSVSAFVNGPSSSENLTMVQGSGGRWYLNRTYGDLGRYGVVIWATDGSGNSVSQAAGFDIAAGGSPTLPAPASVTVTVTDGVVEISWSPVASPGLAGYHVYRRVGAAGSFSRLTVAPFPASMPTVYRDGSTEPDRTYVYTVTAVDTAGSESPYAPEFTVTIPPYHNPPIFDPVPWAVAGVTLSVILGAIYGTIWRRRAA